MIQTSAYISVPEAARQLKRSEEQVRRYLRLGKLKGQRVGNQWFVARASIEAVLTSRLVPADLLERISTRAARIERRNPRMPDVVELLHVSREGH